MEKRGLSNVITILIFILLAIIALGTIWVIVSRVISTSSEEAVIRNKALSIDVEISSVEFPDPEREPLRVNVNIKQLSGSTTVLQTAATPTQTVEAEILMVSDVSWSMDAGECREKPDPSCTCTTTGYEDCTQEPYCSEECGGTLLSRFEASKYAHNSFIDQVLNSEVRIGIIGFHGRVWDIYSHPLSTDANSLKNVVNNEWDTAGGTRICLAIIEAMNEYRENAISGREKVVLLMTDGIPAEDCKAEMDDPGNAYNGDDDIYDPWGRGGYQRENSPKDYAYQAVIDAKDEFGEELTIHTIGFFIDEKDKPFMEAMAQAGGGTYYDASNIDELTAIYEQIAGEVEQEYVTKHANEFLKVVFHNEEETKSHYIDISDLPRVLETKRYEFNLADEGADLDNINKIEVYPGFFKKNGDEVLGQLIARWEA